MRINFDDIWQKCLKYSRIEFVCFSFRVGLLSCQHFVFQTGHWALCIHASTTQ